MLSLLLGCGAHTGGSIPRTLDGAPTRGAFVPPSAYEAHIRGELLLAQGRAEEAVRAFSLATTAPDEDAYLLSRLALAQLRAGDREAAEQTLAHASRIDACSEEVFLTRGLVAEEAHDPRAARQAYARAAACAPRSASPPLALARLMAAQGDQAGALALLIDAAEQPYAERVAPAIHRALADAEPAALAHALARLGTQRAPAAATVEQATALALRRGLPRLALRTREQHPAHLPARLEAEILLANAQRAELAALLARSSADELGGAEQAAKLALAAGAYERAELEASSALAVAESDALHDLRAQARLALGRLGPALADARAVGDPERRRVLLTALLAGAGAPALAAELARHAPTPAPR